MDVVVIRKGRNLRQMRDAQNLIALGDAPFNFFPTASGRAASDAGIDFVEDQRPLRRHFFFVRRSRMTRRIRPRPRRSPSNASMTRDSSPPDAICSSGRHGLSRIG